MRFCLLSLLLLAGCSQERRWQGENRMETLQLKPREHLIVQAHECGLTLEGDFGGLQVSGDDNYIEVRGRIRQLRVEGKSNLVTCHQVPEHIQLKGQGQRVRVPRADKTPHIQVEGQDQAVQFSSPAVEALPSHSEP